MADAAFQTVDVVARFSGDMVAAAHVEPFDVRELQVLSRTFPPPPARVVSRSSEFCSQRVWKWSPSSSPARCFPEVFQGHAQTGARRAGIVDGMIPLGGAFRVYRGVPMLTPFFLHTRSPRIFPAGQKELKITWSQISAISPISASLKAGANTWVSRPKGFPISS